MLMATFAATRIPGDGCHSLRYRDGFARNLIPSLVCRLADLLEGEVCIPRNCHGDPGQKGTCKDTSDDLGDWDARHHPLELS